MVGWRVSAALASRIRKTLKTHRAPVPNPTGQPRQHLPTQWVFHNGVEIHGLVLPGEGPVVLHLADAPQRLLHLLGNPYLGRHGSKYS
jgi:hypothetical protein